MNDDLLKALIELNRALTPFEIKVIVGGGLGLYLKTVFIKDKVHNRYDITPDQRTTNDMDLFLTGELLVDINKMKFLRDTISKLGYLPKTPYLQFYKMSSQNNKIGIDLLTTPPEKEDIKNLHIKGSRIRPKNLQKIHAFLTEEASGISIGLKTIHLEENNIVFVPSNFNYLIFKLYAFKDRQTDPDKDYGRHHAYDIFTTIITMTEDDWNLAKIHKELERNKNYLKQAAEYQKLYFNSKTSLGTIRIRENKVYQRDSKIFDSLIDMFIEDMTELFEL